ncbi:MAG: glycosyltransferase [Rhodospirillales bacterium]|nr:glycosyltransferase [Rhodospirillales bacterium]
MATWNRRHFVPLALRCFLAQDYDGPSELVVIDDGPDLVGDLVEAAIHAQAVRELDSNTRMPERNGRSRQIRYVHLHGRSSIGAKFNLGIRVAHGDVLALWADDDWHAPQRLSVQVDALEQSGARMCGSDQVVFADLRTGEAWRYEYIPHRRTHSYLVGGTMMFRRSFWNERPFEDRSSAEDNAFIAQRGEPFCNIGSDWWYVATMHDGNTSPKPLELRQGSDQWARLGSPAEGLVEKWWWDAAIHEFRTNARIPEAE